MKRKHDVLPVLLTTLGIILGAGGLWLIRSMGPDFKWGYILIGVGCVLTFVGAVIQHGVDSLGKFVDYAREGMHECSLFPGVKELLARLKEAGLFLATATSKPRDVVLPILEEQGILPCFDLVGGASMDKSVDTKTAVIRQDLADPRLAGRRILMVGDRRDDMQGAADCGLPAAAVLYGYGSRAELEPWRPVCFAPDTAALADFLLAEA